MYYEDHAMRKTMTTIFTLQGEVHFVGSGFIRVNTVFCYAMLQNKKELTLRNCLYAIGCMQGKKRV